jgi:hypothetical protein
MRSYLLRRNAVIDQGGTPVRRNVLSRRDISSGKAKDPRAIPKRPAWRRKRDLRCLARESPPPLSGCYRLPTRNILTGDGGADRFATDGFCADPFSAGALCAVCKPRAPTP